MIKATEHTSSFIRLYPWRSDAIERSRYQVLFNDLFTFTYISLTNYENKVVVRGSSDNIWLAIYLLDITRSYPDGHVSFDRKFSANYSFLLPPK